MRSALIRFALACLPGFAASSAFGAADGLQFICNPGQVSGVQSAMVDYLHALNIADTLFQIQSEPEQGRVSFSLKTPIGDTNTLDLTDRADLHVPDEWVDLPGPAHTVRHVRTVSQKEIVLALMQHGRQTVFAGRACDVRALREHVALRQNIVAWAESLDWGWPDGGAANWNIKYWHRGTPDKQWPLETALLNVFNEPDKYAFGCYTATKLVMLQGILDYHVRHKHNGDELTARLMADADPLVHVEPADMWAFEDDFDPQDQHRPGKLLKLVHAVAPLNFVPGDWIYIVNTDPATRDKTGYEGSNALYLGRNRFDDYYNDNEHAYTYAQKIDEVYQWRHGVFSRSRDAAKIRPMSEQDLVRFGRPPNRGGLVEDYRVVPYLFGFEDMPSADPVTASDSPAPPARSSDLRPSTPKPVGDTAAPNGDG